jgi:hypothetical protein
MAGHIQQENLNSIYRTVAHTCEKVPHKTVAGEGVHWVDDQAGEGLVGSSEEHRVFPQHGDLMKVGVECD